MSQNDFMPRTFGTFCFAATAQADPKRQNKKSQIANALFRSVANYLLKNLPLFNSK